MILSAILKILLILLSITLTAALLALFGFIFARFEKAPDTKEKDDRDDARTDGEALRAVTLCDTVPPRVPENFAARGFTDCSHAARTFGGFTACPHACLGIGSCAVVCPSNAIEIRAGGITVTDACVGCGKCVAVCPRALIRLIPLSLRGSLKCAGAPVPGTADICLTARNGHMIDYREFPDSFFKNLDTWGIIRKKSRYE